MVGCLVVALLAGLLWLVPGAQAQRGAAVSIALALQPSSITADGGSTSTATVTVNDGTGTGVPGETITVSSSDLNEQISAVSDNGDGTYTATITSSTTAGAPTITASDQAAGLTTAQNLTQTPGAPTHIGLSLQPSSITADGASTSTATATLTDASGNRVPGQAVAFSSTDANESISGATDNGNGTYTATITSSTTVGTPTIMAADQTATLSTQQTLTQVLGSPTHIALSLAPSSIPADGTSTTKAMATVTDSAGHGIPGETVQFMSADSGDSISGTTDNGDGTYTAIITSSTTVGTPTITARDQSAGLSSHQTLTQTIGAPAHIALSIAPSSILADGHSTSTAKATVTDAAGHGVPGATITFSSTDTGETISATTYNGNGIYTATITSSTTIGTPTITVSDATAGLSTGQTLTQTIGPPARITLSLAPQVIQANGASTSNATATVTDVAGHGIANQTVRFSSTNPGEGISGTTPQGGGAYTATITSSFTVGSYSVTAKDFTAGLTSAPQSLKEVSSASTTTVVASPSSVSTNQSVALVASVSSPAAVFGTIDFFAGLVPIPGCTGLPAPSAVCQTSFAASSSPVTVVAVYTASLASSSAGSSAATTVPVAKDSSSTSVSASSPTATVDAAATFVASVAPAHLGGRAPTGSVQFEQGGKPLASCSSVTLQAAVGPSTATCTVVYQSPGSHRITAVYGGDQNFTGSSSGGLQVPVQALGRINSSMQWVFGFTPRYTTVASLLVSGVSLGTTVTIICKGHGCPFAKRTSTLSGGGRCARATKHHCGPHRKGPVNLTRAFHRRRLIAGTRITVEISRPGWVGKYYSFLIRASRAPQVRISCLAPGLSKPGIAC
ncbi:MAG: Ig-like domain-containing protein [Actinomycetota bacterium]|nr:Ig-like domain-containing protein [Actinomycetota bacterium]